MIAIRRADERGHADHGWLDTYHTFSFADYYDPRNMGFRSLRVINDDRVAPGRGFGMHAHNDMEIITVVLEGALEHRDSMGNVGVIKPGEVQRMSAGTGVRHSEYNPSPKEPVHLYQIWIQPEKRGVTPSYEQKAFPVAERKGKLKLLAAREAQNGNVRINQDAQLYAAALVPGDTVTYELRPERGAWLQAVRGSVTVNGQTLAEGDGAAIEDEAKLTIAAADADAEVLLFDLA